MEREFWILWMTVNIIIVWTPIKSTESCPAAVMTASPGTVIHHGHPINLTCTLAANAKHCTPGSKEEIKIYGQNTFLPGTPNTDSVTVRDFLPPPGETNYECWKCIMLCVISVFAGFPPDQPRSVTCEQEGEVGKMSCSWESGRETFIETTCTLRLLQKTQNVTVSSKCSSQAKESLVLPVTIAVGGEYTVLVQASNELGENASTPYTFTYIDAVKPYPPSDITVICDTSHDCTVTFHTNQDVQHFRLRYRITNERIWKQTEVLSSRSLTLHNLRPLSRYEFQAACKYKIDRGKWSNWSHDVTHETPEDAPRDKIEVWYSLHRVNKTVTVFWKYMNLSALRGQIQFYQVIFQDSEHHDKYIQNTTNAQLSRNIEPEGCLITISAHNTMGSSPPTSVRVTTYSLSGFPAPTNVIAIGSSPENVTISWELPSGVKSAGDQIVAWEDPTGKDQSHTNWITIPQPNRSVTISGHLKPHICYQIYVYLLWEGRAGLPGTTQGSIKQKAPLTAPKFKYEVHKENSILVTWKEIPAEARMGCITHYSIYLSSQTTRVIEIFSNQSTFYQYEIDNIEKNVQFSLEMTCTNEAGESPLSPLISAYIQSDVSEDGIVVLVVVVLLIIGFLFSILFGKQRVQCFLKILRRWWKSVPDPANCEWAKECISNKEKWEILPTVASSISDCDNEIIEVEEVTSGEEEALASVFSYKIDIASIRIPQEDIIRSLREDLEGTAAVPTIKRAQGGVQKLLQLDHPSLDYLGHNDMKPSAYLSHHITQSNNPAQYEIKSDCQSHQDIKLLDSMMHHDIKPSDYLAHHEIKPPASLVHQDSKLLNSVVNHIKATAYLVHNENKVDYLPPDLLTILEDPNKEQSEPFHQQLFLPVKEGPNHTISLDTVQIIFPYSVQ